MWSAQVVFTCTSVAEKVVNWEEVIELCIGMEIVARGRGGFVAQRQKWFVVGPALPHWTYLLS